MALEYVSTGTVVSNKAIGINTAVTLNGNAYYMARVTGLAAHSVAGAVGDYGIWRATGKTGGRLTVVTAGEPASTAEVLWDLQSGRIYRGQQGTVYAYYVKYADLMNEGRIYQISIPGAMTGTATDVWQQISPWDWRPGSYAISVHGNRPSGTFTLQLRNATAGGGSGVSVTLASGETVDSAAYKTISGISFGPGQKIVIRNPGGSVLKCSNIQITLLEALEQ